jgi:NitT/TauT family transport system substrate-binding protein
MMQNFSKTRMIWANPRNLELKVLRVVALFLAAAITTFTTPTGAMDQVKMRLDWVFGTEHSGVFVALEKGYFKEAGIDVQVFPGEGSSVTVKLVGTGDVDFGYATADQALLADARGLPVVTTAVILQSNPIGIVFPKNQGIKTLTDLYGKRLGVQFKSAVERQWRAVAKTQNIDTSRIIEVPADLAIGKLIIAGRIDAGVAFFFNDGIQPITEGIDMDWILFRDFGLRMYSSGLIVNAETIKKNPDLVRRFTKAFVRGWEYAKAHPEEAYALTVKANPLLDNKYNKLKLPAVLTLTESEDTKKNGIGYSSKEGWEALVKTLVDLDLLKQPIDVSRVYTNEFLK